MFSEGLKFVLQFTALCKQNHLDICFVCKLSKTYFPSKSFNNTGLHFDSFFRVYWPMVTSCDDIITQMHFICITTDKDIQKYKNRKI